MPESGNPVRKSPCGLTRFLGNRDRTLVESATARASTGDQTLELQPDVLRAEDCERIFEGTLGRNGRVPALHDTFDHLSVGAHAVQVVAGPHRPLAEGSVALRGPAVQYA